MKKVLAWILSVVMLMMLATSCAPASPSSAEPDTSAASDSETDGTGEVEIENFNPEGYPIVDEKITLSAVVTTGSFYGDFNTMEYFKKLEELTNIKIEFEQVVDKPADFFNLMFASADYRDITFRGLADSDMLGLIEADAIYAIDDYKQYTPILNATMEAYPEGAKICRMGDGIMYGYPQIREEPSNVGIRDQWMINQQWLTELGLDMPETVDDFYNVLKAFKDNAGTGTIPAEVIPWYLSWDAYSNGGQFELYNAFGVWTPGNFSANHYLAVAEDGKTVSFSANDPAIKEPLEFLNKLYAEGLIPPDAFTGANTYEQMVTSETVVVGSFLKYFNTDDTHTIWAPMPPLTSENNPDGMYRRQINGFGRNRSVIYKVNEYPEATVRLLEVMAEPDWTVEAMYGLYGEYLEKDGDSYIQLPFEGNEVYENVPGNMMHLMITPEIGDKIQYSGSQADRADTIENVYSSATMPQERYYPNLVWTAEEIEERTALETDIDAYISQTFARWITEGGIEEEWDSYVAELEQLKINELLAIYQGALDRFNG